MNHWECNAFKSNIAELVVIKDKLRSDFFKFQAKATPDDLEEARALNKRKNQLDRRVDQLFAECVHLPIVELVAAVKKHKEYYAQYQQLHDAVRSSRLFPPRGWPDRMSKLDELIYDHSLVVRAMLKKRNFYSFHRQKVELLKFHVLDDMQNELNLGWAELSLGEESSHESNPSALEEKGKTKRIAFEQLSELCELTRQRPSRRDKNN